MSDLIRRSDAIKAVNKAKAEGMTECPTYYLGIVPTIEPKRGKWEEKETFRNGDDDPIIEEWQSARCSVCGKYCTTPYMYYFNDYNFCPNCGADMRGENNETDKEMR